MLHVKSVQKCSIAEDIGLEPGTRLLAIDGRELRDFLDWEFLTAESEFVLEVQTPGGTLVEYDVERPEGFPLGVELEPPEVIRCDNRCDFCFVKGNPKGLRKALYVKDDDYRLSFRYGNFVTLTNLETHDLDRIVEYKLSPLYVSVHSTNLDVRRRLLRNPHAPDLMEQMAFLLGNGIEFHTQIVLQPGINDGAELMQTLEDLYSLGEGVFSVSVVPVGLTDRNDGGFARKPMADECRAAILAVDTIASRALAARGTHWAYGSDELFLNAKLEIPPAERYDGFEQLENGVGAFRYFELKIAGFAADLRGKTVGLATGTAMGRLFPDILSKLQDQTGARFELLVLENGLFGPSVTTAGLLPGRQFSGACEGRNDLDLMLIPAEAVNEDGLFVDDVSFAQLSAAAPVEIRMSYDIVDAFEGELA